MAFMVLAIQKNMLVQEQDDIQYQETVASNNYQNVTEQLAKLSEFGCSMDSTPAKQLQYSQELYEAQQSSLDSQLKVIQNELDSYNKAIDTNIKSDCKFSLSA